MTHISDNTTVEGKLDFKTERYQAVVQATANSTQTVAVTDATFWIFTGTTAGQIFKLGDATTYSVGHHYIIHNNSTQPITMQNNGAVSLGTIVANARTKITAQDVSTSNGIWSIDTSGTPNSSGTEKTIYFGKGADVNNAYIPSAAGSGTTSDIATDGFCRPIKVVGYFLDYDSAGANITKTFSIILREKSALGVNKYTINKPISVQSVYAYDPAGFTTYAAGERMTVFAQSGTGNAFVPKLTIWYVWND